MKIFKNKERNRSAFPEGLAATAERLGRNALDPAATPDLSLWDEVLAPLLSLASADPDGFCVRLASDCLPIGGFTAYGAERLVLELIGLPEARPAIPETEQILDAAI